MDASDRRLLFELDWDARQSWTKISSKISLSKESIGYRARRLENAGVIRGYRMLFDEGKLGFTQYRALLRFASATPAKESEIADWLARHPHVVRVAQLSGDWHLAVWCRLRHPFELATAWHAISEKYGNFLEAKSVCLVGKTIRYPHAYLWQPPGHQNPRHEGHVIYELRDGAKSVDTSLDAVDKKLCAALAINARLPTSELAKACGCTEKTAAKRLHALKQSGLLRGTTLQLDRKKLGLNEHLVLIDFHDRNHEKEARLAEFARHHANIISGEQAVGGHDAEWHAVTNSQQELDQLLDDLRSHHSDIVKNARALEIKKEHKHDGKLVL